MWAFFVSMADNLNFFSKANIFNKDAIVKEIDSMLMYCTSMRRLFERKWYDHNFFDDGYHFRYLSRTTGKIIDQSQSAKLGMPERAIPKASRQLRGVANLLLQPDYTPVVYPDEMEADKEKAKNDAKALGLYIKDQWDKLHLKNKLSQAVVLAGKHSVSYVKLIPDYANQKIVVGVRDAFDLYLKGELDDLQDSPFVIEAFPRLISEIKADNNFDPELTKNITADNKHASSEIKEAYLKARYGTGTPNDFTATLIQKEAWIKTPVTQDNLKDIKEMASPNNEFEVGRTAMRHTITAGGVKLLDEYLDMEFYPYVPIQLEAGPLYQTALIERFIPANKSLDIAMSRIERYANTMITGTWLRRKGENFDFTNIPGGQVLEYETTPPTQGQMASIPPFMFQYIEMLNRIIEEQGASTTALNQLPQGVKSGKAIEMVKATEYANLKIPSEQLKIAVQKIAEIMVNYAADFVLPISVGDMNSQGDVTNYQLVGERRNNIQGLEPLNAVVIKKGTKVNIEVEAGLGFTSEGKKETMQQIVTYMSELAQQGLISSDAVKVVTQKFLNIFQFGSTQEFMDNWDKGNQTTPLSEQQLQQMKVAMLETLKDAGIVGQEADKRLVDSTKVGVLEAQNDLKGGNNAQGVQ